MLMEFAFAFVLWCWMTAEFSIANVFVGLLTALLTAAAAEVFRALSLSKFYPHAHVVSRGTPGIIVDAVRDCWLLLGILLSRPFTRPSRGGFRTLPFEADGDDSRSETRRALALTLMTVSPNSLAIDIDRRRNLLLYHELAASEPPRIATRMSHP